MTRRLRVSFTVTLLTAFSALFLLSIGAVILGYRATGQQAALAEAERSLDLAADLAAANARVLIGPVLGLAAVLAEGGAGATEHAAGLPAWRAVLEAQPSVVAVSLGQADGGLRQLLRLPAATPPPPPGAVLALREAEADAARWSFLDADGRTLAVTRTARGADHRQSPWFLGTSGEAVQVSTLYDLAAFGRPGLSVSRRVPGAGEAAVLALDMTLEALAAALAAQRLTANSQTFVFNEDAILLAHQRSELAVIPRGDGRSSWTTLNHAADPLLREVGALYAIGWLRPGTTQEIATAAGPVLVRLERLDESEAPRLYVAVAAPLADFTGPLDRALARGTLLALLSLLGGLVLLALLAFGIARPLAALTGEADQIRALALDERPPVQSRIAEIARLADAMEAMKGALRQFGVYVPRDLVAELMQRGEAARIGGARRRVTLMFSDVQGFTTLAEELPPEELMTITSHYFEAVTQELQANHATIDKFIGDAVMAIWNAPRDDASHAHNACLAALRARALTLRLADAFAARGWPRLVTRFGVHTGEAVVGNVGASDRMAWTAIGAMVNLAARLEGMNKVYGTAILISEATRAAAGPLFVTRPVDLVRAKGARQPVEVHELMGLAVVDGAGDAALRPPADRLAALPAWTRVVAAWRAGDFADAEAALAACPADDPVAALYAARLAARRAAATNEEWTPVMALETK